MDMYILAVYVKVFSPDMQQGHFFHYENDTQNPGQQLCEYCGYCRTRNPHMKDEDECIVQNYIYHTGQDKKIQRSPAVSQRADDVGKKIEQNDRRNPEEHDPKIDVCIGDDLGRRLQQAKQRRGDQYRGNCHYDCKNSADEYTHSKASAHACGIAGTEFLCGNDRKSSGKSADKSEDQKIDPACAANGSEGIDADRPAYDQSVGHAVKLLKNVACDQRKRKLQNKEKWFPLCESLCHGDQLLFLKNSNVSGR